MGVGKKRGNRWQYRWGEKIFVGYAQRARIFSGGYGSGGADFLGVKFCGGVITKIFRGASSRMVGLGRNSEVVEMVRVGRVSIDERRRGGYGVSFKCYS